MTRNRAAVFLCFAWALSCISAISAGASEPPRVEKELFGYLEHVELLNTEFVLPAKLDTGADTSSLDATHIKRFRYKGKSTRWVRFTVEDPATGETTVLEREYVRSARIKRHDGEHQRRPVVTVSVCIGTHEREIEVSLIDRSHFDYPLLLGRSALQGLAVVDSDLSYSQDPLCETETDSGAKP